MTVRRFVVLVLSTVCIGVLMGCVVTFTGLLGEVRPFRGIITGGFISATSLMGFWAYLTLNFIMRGFVTFRAWVITQAVIIGLVYVDMVILRHDLMAPSESYGPFLWFATCPLVIAVFFAWVKTKLSGRKSFVPALFFMYVFTVVEWIPDLKITSDLSMQTMMGIVLLACNAYLLLILGKIILSPNVNSAKETIQVEATNSAQKL